MSEKFIKKWMDEKYPEFVYQKRIHRFKVDWFLDYGEYCIILECDEKAHYTYDQCKELFRMVNIREIIKKPIIFIRFCPDVFHKGMWNFLQYEVIKRLNMLFSTIEELLISKTIEAQIIVTYMYYGRFCMNTKKIRIWNVTSREELIKYLANKTSVSEEYIRDYKKTKINLLRNLYSFIIS